MTGAAMLVFGIVRVELAALLWGSVFLGAQLYAFVAVAVASALRRGEDYAPRAVIAPRECGIGDEATASVSAPRRFLPPAVAVRCELPLRTADGRSLDFSVDPERGGPQALKAAERGAFGAAFDRLVVEDAFGFFRAVRPVAAEAGTRLAVLPAPIFGLAAEPPAGGGEERRTERSYARTDDLTESRKYNPGDDPRRINWKLYGHAGELFVREGENEPPPRSVVTVLVDGCYDPALLQPRAAREAVDELVSRAVGSLTELSERGFEVFFGGSGVAVRALRGGTAREAAVALSAVAAVPTGSEGALPASAGDSLIVFALPRRPGEGDPLRRLLAARSAAGGQSSVLLLSPGASAEGERSGRGFSLRSLLFRTEAGSGRNAAAGASGLRAALDGCVRSYGELRGVRARAIEG